MCSLNQRSGALTGDSWGRQGRAAPLARAAADSLVPLHPAQATVQVLRKAGGAVVPKAGDAVTVKVRVGCAVSAAHAADRIPSWCVPGFFDPRCGGGDL